MDLGKRVRSIPPCILSRLTEVLSKGKELYQWGMNGNNHLLFLRKYINSYRTERS
jgi:hypothetical protein